MREFNWKMLLQDHRKGLQLHSYLATVLLNAVQRWHAAGYAQLEMTNYILLA